jgi:hypothetical protein
MKEISKQHKNIDIYDQGQEVIGQEYFSFYFKRTRYDRTDKTQIDQESGEKYYFLDIFLDIGFIF